MICSLLTTRCQCTDVFRSLRVVIFLLVCFFLGACGSQEEEFPELESLNDTFDQLGVFEPQSIYVNAAARDEIAKEYPGILEAWVPAWSEASRDGGLWRSQHRKNRFDTVVLSGPANDYHPLVTHLMQSPDWRLAWLDNQALIFRNDGLEEWSPAPADSVGELYENESKRAVFLAQLAGNLSIAGLHREAEEYLAEAMRLDDGNSEVRAIAALMALRNQQMDIAEEEAEAAVRANRSNPLALQMLVEMEIRLGKGDKALEHAEEFEQRHGRSISSLYQLVRAANAAKFPAREAEYLEELIAEAKERNLSTGVLHVFLGQAYARLGDARKAAKQFEQALASTELAREQRLDIEEALKRVKANTD